MLPLRQLGLALVLLASGAGAQSVSDDFEGAVLDPVWNPVVGGAGRTYALETNARHGGLKGLRITDSNSTASADANQVFVELDFPTSTGFDYHARSWFRVQATGSVPQVVFLEFYGRVSTGTNAQVFALRFDSPSLEVRAVGWQGAPESYLDQPVGFIQPDVYYLVEMSLLGIGSLTGRRRVWIDGQSLVDEPVDLSSYSVQALLVGETWAGGALTGTLDFDEVRASPRWCRRERRKV